MPAVSSIVATNWKLYIPVFCIIIRDMGVPITTPSKFTVVLNVTAEPLTSVDIVWSSLLENIP